MEGLSSKKRTLNTDRTESRMQSFERHVMAFAARLYEENEYDETNSCHCSLFMKHIVFNETDDFFDVMPTADDHIVEMPFRFARMRPAQDQQPLIFVSKEENEATYMVVIAHDYAHFHVYD